MRLSALFLLNFVFLLVSADPRSANAQNSAAQAWKSCQSSDADQRLAGCSLVIAQNAGGSKARLADALDGRCWAYHVKGSYDLAVADCKASITLRSNYPFAFNNLASAYLGLRKYDDALSAASRAVELKPNFLWSHLNRARAYTGLGLRDKALAEYQIVLAIDPKNADAKAESKVEETQTAVTDTRFSSQTESLAPIMPSVAKPPPTTTATAERRIALIVGNSRYQSVPELPNPAGDASLIARTLKAVGFNDVRVETDLSRDALNRVLLEFSRAAASADWAMIYYSGHGIEVGGLDYLIPVDAKLQTDRDVDFETVPLALAISSVDPAKRLRMVIMDACRSNPFLTQMKRTIATRSLGRGLAAVEPEPGSLVIFSAKNGETALDGEGANSPFAIALANRLGTPGLEVRRLFDLVRDDVITATGRHQQPFAYGSLSGSEDYFFAKKQ
ncbi:Tetratricopeptide repeat-containing protein [Bradyrhizobium erythrophlei]|nr:Tetratricopeptide repeat-containing protein [Bradyrhizobium erythrophlei]